MLHDDLYSEPWKKNLIFFNKSLLCVKCLLVYVAAMDSGIYHKIFRYNSAICFLSIGLNGKEKWMKKTNYLKIISFGKILQNPNGKVKFQIFLNGKLTISKKNIQKGNFYFCYYHVFMLSCLKPVSATQLEVCRYFNGELNLIFILKMSQL